MLFHLTRKAGNQKIGRSNRAMPTAVTTQSRDTCPTDCPLLGECYAEDFMLGYHWDKVDSGERGIPFTAFLKQLRALPSNVFLRYGQAGDLPGKGNDIDRPMLSRLIDAIDHVKVKFTYTHKRLTPSNVAAIQDANRRGFTVNLSANNLTHADELLAKHIAPVVVVVPENTEAQFTTPAGNKGIVCPAQTFDGRFGPQKRHVTCADCKLCSLQKRNLIGFRAHGTNKKTIDRIVKEQ